MVDSQIVGFSVIIKDPCESAILEIAPASLTDLQIILYYKTKEQKQQTYKLQTDVERLHNIFCPISAVLIPATV